MLENGQELNFDEALYHSNCNFCEDRLSWEAAFDADGTGYHTQCCGYDYWFYTSKVQIGFSPTDE